MVRLHSTPIETQRACSSASHCSLTVRRKVECGQRRPAAASPGCSHTVLRGLSSLRHRLQSDYVLTGNQPPGDVFSRCHARYPSFLYATRRLAHSAVHVLPPPAAPGCPRPHAWRPSSQASGRGRWGACFLFVCLFLCKGRACGSPPGRCDSRLANSQRAQPSHRRGQRAAIAATCSTPTSIASLSNNSRSRGGAAGARTRAQQQQPRVDVSVRLDVRLPTCRRADKRKLQVPSLQRNFASSLFQGWPIRIESYRIELYDSVRHDSQKLSSNGMTRTRAWAGARARPQSRSARRTASASSTAAAA